MKDKLLFRIIGSLSSSLIILSVFMPFTRGDALSIWNLNSGSDMIYLPIMIIVYGVIGVVFFALNYKTEFAYATSGAITFYSGTQLIQAINFNTVENLGLGFYLIAISGIVVGIMAFICNINRKKKTNSVEQVSIPQVENSFMINPNINNNLNENNNNTLEQTFGIQQNIPDNSISVNNNIGIPEVGEQNNVVPPITSAEIPEIKPQVTPIPEVGEQNNVVPPITSPEIPEIKPQVTPIPEVGEQNNIVPPITSPEIPEIKPQVTPIPEVGEKNIDTAFETNKQETILNDFTSIPEISINPISTEEKKQEEVQDDTPKVNPVLQEFTNQQFTPVQVNPSTRPVDMEMSENSSALNSSVGQVTNTSSNMQGLDIFGNFK